VASRDTPFELVYELHHMMLKEYLLPTINFQTCKDFVVIKILINIVSKLERLDESRQEIAKTT
jgi:hypothetical protein